jgi:hypothetical protein
MKRIIAIFIIALVTPLFSSCIFDAEKVDGGGGPPPGPAFRDLTERDDVLFNLTESYNQRNWDEYNKLLDDKFIFNFSVADYNDGKVEFLQWDRAAEIAATRNILDPSAPLPPGRDPVSSIDLTITFVDGADDWQPVTPDQQEFPGETHYKQNVDYFLNVVAGETTFTSGNPIKAEYVVRLTNVGGTDIWRIVSWRDDILAQ